MYFHPELLNVHLKVAYKNRVPAYTVQNSRKNEYKFNVTTQYLNAGTTADLNCIVPIYFFLYTSLMGTGGREQAELQL